MCAVCSCQNDIFHYTSFEFMRHCSVLWQLCDKSLSLIEINNKMRSVEFQECSMVYFSDCMILVICCSFLSIFYPHIDYWQIHLSTNCMYIMHAQ